MDKNLLDQLAARAEQKAKDRLAVKVFSVGGVDMQFHKPKQAEQLEYYGTLAEAEGAENMIGVCTSLIYDSCPTLQDPELHKTLGVIDPYDAVRQLMSVREIDRLGGELFQWNGLMPDKPDGGQTAEDMAKNS